MLEKIYYDGTRKRQKIKSQYKGVEMAEISVQYGEIESLLEGRGDDDLERKRQKKAIKPRPSSKKLKVWHGETGSIEPLNPDGFYSSDFAVSKAVDDDPSTYFMSKRADSVTQQGRMFKTRTFSDQFPDQILINYLKGFAFRTTMNQWEVLDLPRESFIGVRFQFKLRIRFLVGFPRKF